MPPRKKINAVTFDEHLALVVDSKRQKTQLTVREFGDAVGIDYSTIRRRLAGSPFTVNELERIAVLAATPAHKMVEEALNDFGGIEKLLAEYAPVSEPAPSVDPSDEIPYIGPVTPPVGVAASKRPEEE